MSDQRVNIEKELSELMFKQRENNFIHNSFSAEMLPYELIRQGDLSGVELAQEIYCGGKTGNLSDDPVRNKQYLFVATITVLCRVCIESGMDSAESYGLSDLFIRKADKQASVEALNHLHREMLTEYTKRMQQVKRKEGYSTYVVGCINYVDQHLMENLSIPQIAEHLLISSSYLSTLFSKETGMSLSNYIRERKLEAARALLQHSDYTCSEIAEYFGFSSSAHFSKAFREYTGYTPTAYRKLFFQKNPIAMENLQ